MDRRAAANGQRNMTGPRQVQALLFASRWPENLLPTIVSLRSTCPGMRLVLGGPALGETARSLPVDELITVHSLAALVNHVCHQSGDHILAVGDAVIAPDAFLDRALNAVQDDMRVGTVSFFSNSAGHLSFPERNVATVRGVDGADETMITRRLRENAPAPALAPIPFPGGAMVLVSGYALGAVGPMTAHPSGSMASMLLEFSLSARRRGFIDFLDAGTYVSRPPDLTTRSAPPPFVEDAELTGLVARHPYFAAFRDRELTSTSSPLALAHSAARAKVTGLSVVIEAQCLGPLEMGTQVQTLALIKALANRADVARVGVALAIPPPVYAQDVLRMPKVEARITAPDDFSSFGHVDIVHRSYQPGAVDVQSWRRVATRTLVTIQDLIAYQIGDYHQTGAEWLAYRDSQHTTARAVDGVVVVSEDTALQLSREALPVDSTRVFVVPNGTDHLTGGEAAQVPGSLATGGVSDSEFLLMLGTNYAHKNRDLGILAWNELRARGWRHSLVLAGAHVGYGSSRLDEVSAGGNHPDVLTLPDVSTNERNWLLRHASLLLYPTSAEGFGLVPYEAARFGTPTVAIPFGPLTEVNPDAPIWSADWGASSLADAAEALLLDPGVARDQVAATIAAGASFRWEYTASRLVEVYRTLLGWPARS